MNEYEIPEPKKDETKQDFTVRCELALHGQNPELSDDEVRNMCVNKWNSVRAKIEFSEKMRKKIPTNRVTGEIITYENGESKLEGQLHGLYEDIFESIMFHPLVKEINGDLKALESVVKERTQNTTTTMHEVLNVLNMLAELFKIHDREIKALAHTMRSGTVKETKPRTSSPLSFPMKLKDFAPTKGEQNGKNAL